MGDMVNSRGDFLDPTVLNIKGVVSSPTGNLWPWEDDKSVVQDATKFSEILNNWLTAGGPPKPLDPSLEFGKQQNNAGVEARAAAGQGMAGLFGFGKTIGSMSPMAPGVPYSVAPAPKPGLNPLFNPAYGGTKFGGK
jgi:hypothetical protein